MKRFLKWTLSAAGLLGIIAFFTVLGNDVPSSRIPTIIITIASGSVVLGLFFYLIETYLIPWRKRQIQRKLVQIFNAQPVTDEIVTFAMGKFEFLAAYSFALVMAEQGSREFINFHIPRTLIDPLTSKPGLKYVADTCNGIDTYRVWQASGSGLKKAQRKLRASMDSADVLR